MKHISRCLLLGAIVVCAAIALDPAFAQPMNTGAPPIIFSQPAPSQTSVDVSALLLQVLTIAATVVSGLAGWAVYKFAGNLGLSQDSATRALIDAGLQKAIGYAVSIAQDKLAGKPVTIEFKSVVVADAVRYAQAHFPDALAYFNIDGAKLAQMIESRLGMAAVAASSTPVAAATASTIPAAPAAPAAPIPAAPAA